MQRKPLTCAHHTHILAVLALGGVSAEGAARQLSLAALAPHSGHHDGQLAGAKGTARAGLARPRQAQLPAHHAGGGIVEAAGAAHRAPAPANLDLH